MIGIWHSLLDMKKYDEAWHKQDVADELEEYKQEVALIKKWSELSDVVYTYTRAKWSGHKISFPFNKWQYYLGEIYMIPKYTSRWLFYRLVGLRMGSPVKIHEVRNPHKVDKLNIIAQRNNLDPDQFLKICERQLKYWPLLP